MTVDRGGPSDVNHTFTLDCACEIIGHPTIELPVLSDCHHNESPPEDVQREPAPAAGFDRLPTLVA